MLGARNEATRILSTAVHSFLGMRNGLPNAKRRPATALVVCVHGMLQVTYATYILGKDDYEINPHVRLRSYGITSQEFDQMSELQDHKCMICQKTLPNRADKHVDHDHKTNRTRALLCGTCNRGLGMFQDNPELLTIAAAYLRGFSVAY